MVLYPANGFHVMQPLQKMSKFVFRYVSLCPGGTASVRIFDAERPPASLILPGGKKIDELMYLCEFACVFVVVHLSKCG